MNTSTDPLTASLEAVLASVDEVAAKARKADRDHIRSMVVRVLASDIGMEDARYLTLFGDDEVEILTDRIENLPKTYLRGDARRLPNYHMSINEVREYLGRIR